MESSIRPSFLRKNRRNRKGLFTRSHECASPQKNHSFTCQKRASRGIPEHSPPAVVGMANQTNRLATGYRVPVDEVFKWP